MSEIYDALDWLIVFEDADINPMPFTDESVARKAYEMKAQSWNCHLFYRVSSDSGIDYPKTEIQKLQAKNDALVARIGRLEEAIRYSTDYLDSNKLNAIGSGSKAHNEMLYVLNETESESLAHIQAETVELFAEYSGVFGSEYDDQGYVEIPRYKIKEYVQQLRQQGKDHD